MEIEYQDSRPSNDEIRESLSEFDLGNVIVQPTDDKGVILRLSDISEEKHQEILEKLKESRELEEMRFESIGPVIGEELKQKTILIIVLSLLSIIAYVSFAFRKARSSIKSWQYGAATLLALGHDVLIPVGVFALLGRYSAVEISIPVVVALLTVLGYSVNDTVVVFDRVRENLAKSRVDSLDEIVNRSLNETIPRSVNTSLTTLFVLFAVFFFGGATLQYFALALIIGVVAGTYSSIFLASPILLAWLNYKRCRE